MSALDDIIARDSAPQQSSALDAIIARDAGPATNAPVIQTAAPSDQMPGSLAAFGAGLGHGFGSAVLGAQQLLGHGAQAIGMDRIGNWLANDANQGIKNIDAQYQPYQQAHPLIGGAGDLGGNVVATAPLTAFAPEMAGASLLTKAGTGAALGAANGAVSPVQNDGSDYWSKKAEQVGMGGAVGGIATPAVSLLRKAVSGATGEAQKRLAAAGVTMTPGQILGGGLQRTEEKLTSIPLVGDLIKNSQQRANQSFNKATYDEVLAPIGQKYSGPIGSDGVESIRNTIGSVYDSALSKMTFRAADPQFQSDIQKLAGMAQNLPPQQQQVFTNVLKTQIFGKLGPQGTMDGQTLKGVQAELSRIAKGYSGDASFDNRQLGGAISEIKNAVDNSLPRYNQGDAVSDLAKANAAYARFARLRTAAASQGAMNNGGVITAAQLANAVRNGDKSVGKGATATGRALMQDFATAGQQVLGSKYPDSGTAGRSIAGLVAGGLAGHQFLPPEMLLPAALGSAGLAAPYTALGQKIAQALLMKRPSGANAVGKAIESHISPIAPLLIPSALTFSQN